MGKTAAVLYARVSSKDQEQEGYSIGQLATGNPILAIARRAFRRLLRLGLLAAFLIWSACPTIYSVK